ncbi:MAG TPA: serine protease, partial [Blastocatellia bacterium]|nr:serine protease [Blastocatellia bacterium]
MMSDEQPIAPSDISLDQNQLDDLAQLLARCVRRGNIAWLATAALGPEALQQAGNDVGDINIFARKIVQALHEGGRISEALQLLYQHSHGTSWLMLGLKRILAKERLGSDANMQAFVNEYEPFLSSEAIQENLPKVLRTVCAVALGNPTNKIVGSGFLIAPDLVITNFHVIAPFLAIDPQTNEVKANGNGDQIYFFFDYLSAPGPKVPPSDGGHSFPAVTAAKDWLVYARQLLAGDGQPNPPKVLNKEYDYAVIRLARPMGNRLARSGGGVRRGWLSLPKEKLDVMSMNKRILVFQHPQRAPQQFDIGDFVQLDPSATRVWYSVSTAHGSSGGAAVDSEGRLFALHNAEVDEKVLLVNGKRVNQGIRIDKIAEDLAVKAPEVFEPPEKDDARLFWSLNDNAQDSRPIIGRSKFRELVDDMMAPEAERVLVVTGPPASGLQFSIKLLQHTLGTQVPVAVFTPNMLPTLG